MTFMTETLLDEYPVQYSTVLYSYYRYDVSSSGSYTISYRIIYISLLHIYFDIIYLHIHTHVKLSFSLPPTTFVHQSIFDLLIFVDFAIETLRSIFGITTCGIHLTAVLTAIMCIVQLIQKHYWQRRMCVCECAAAKQKLMV